MSAQQSRSASILQGKFRRQKFSAPVKIHGHDQITPQKIKEAAFQLIANREQNPQKIVLWDLFSGSGQMGYEGVSREFLQTVFCELDGQRLANINNWIHEHNEQENALALRLDALRAFEKIFSKAVKSNADDFSDCLLAIYADPPYTLQKQGRSTFEILVQEYNRQKSNSIYGRSVLIVQSPSLKSFRRFNQNSNDNYFSLYQKIYNYNSNVLLTID